MSTVSTVAAAHVWPLCHTLPLRCEVSSFDGLPSISMAVFLLAASPLALRLTPPTMMLRDQCGAGRANDFRFEAFGGVAPTERGGRYSHNARYGKGHNAGIATWTQRGGWTGYGRQSAEPDEMIGSVMPTGGMVPHSPPEVPPQWRREGPPLPSVATAPVPAAYKQPNLPDENDGGWDFRHGPGHLADQRHPHETWLTGGP